MTGLVLVTAACGSKGLHPKRFQGPGRTAAVLGSLDSDGDRDGRPGKPFDRDDEPAVLRYGRLASIPTRQAIERLVVGYYDAAATSDGAKGCALLDGDLVSGLAGGAEKTSMADRETECARALARLFRRSLGRSAKELLGVKVMSVRVADRRGYVLIRFPPFYGRYLPVDKRDGIWRLSALSDMGFV